MIFWKTPGGEALVRFPVARPVDGQTAAEPGKHANMRRLGKLASGLGDPLKELWGLLFLSNHAQGCIGINMLYVSCLNAMRGTSCPSVSPPIPIQYSA